jgi:hypothetical protein
MGMKIMLNNGKLNLIILLLLTFGLIYITGERILTISFYESSGDPLSGFAGQGSKVMESLQSWIYVSSAVYLLLKLGIITLILHTGLYLNDQDIPIGRIFRITVLSDFIFLIPAAVKIFSFHYAFPNGTLLDWHHYYFLSALSIFNEVPADWSYALQSLNVFEVTYWFALAYGISKISRLSFDRSLQVIVLYYVSAFVSWIAAVTFFTLMMFPATG